MVDGSAHLVGRKRLVTLATALAMALLAAFVQPAGAQPAEAKDRGEFIEILTPQVRLVVESPGTGFRPMMDVKVRYRCDPTPMPPGWPDPDWAWDRIFIGPTWSMHSPLLNEAVCDGNVQTHDITVGATAALTADAPRSTVRVEAAVGSASTARDVVVHPRYTRYRQIVTAVESTPFGMVEVTFANGDRHVFGTDGSLQSFPAFWAWSYTVNRSAVTPSEFVAAISPGDAFIARGYDFALTESRGRS